MKYLHYILALTLISCLVGIWGIPRLDSKPPTEPADLIINQRIMTATELQARRENSPYHYAGQQEFLDDVITKELLIQEAQRQEIDQEEAFRKAIRDYYEQSLIKTLLDRQYRSLAEQIKQESPADRKNFFCTYQLKIHSYKDLASANKQLADKSRTLTSHYKDLPQDIRDLAVQLRVGEQSPPLADGSHYIRVELIEKKTLAETAATDPDGLNCEEELQRQAMNRWLNDLRRSARIRLPQTDIIPEN